MARAGREAASLEKRSEAALSRVPVNYTGSGAARKAASRDVRDIRA